jgi:hypothetical protein
VVGRSVETLNDRAGCMAFAAGWPVRMSRLFAAKGSGTRLSSRFRSSGSGAGTLSGRGCQPAERLEEGHDHESGT